jgi:hypothetical protein
MKMFSYPDVLKNFSALLDAAQTEEVEIIRDGVVFSLVSKQRKKKSPFDLPGIKTKATTSDILDAIRESRLS